ncbi:phage holin family protein [Crassaminicella profunda]|uniref:phage holin family protein n=1 Tax=Crassaminicella profunda TaxID=1286698 RepID=UPI001CA724B7|nr:phage holin family protein [Crassaminicella profunda]QZY56726.1 phage holin family protein [Crassaminicella profunda]
MDQLINYMDKVASGTKPFWGTILAIISYVMFPDKAYQTAAFAVGGAIMLDIITKYIALSHECHGYRNAVRERKIFSKTLWEGTRIKLVSYLIVFILAGLAYRVTMLKQVSVFLATIVYSVIFLREGQSILENLCDAGADLKWLLIWTKKKEQQILESEIEERSDDVEKI